MAFAGCSATRVSLSTARLERISWTVPMAVLAMAITRNIMFLYEPAMTSKAARMRKIRLKKVRVFSRMICPSDLEGDSPGSLDQPEASRAWTWA